MIDKMIFPFALRDATYVDSRELESVLPVMDEEEFRRRQPLAETTG